MENILNYSKKYHIVTYGCQMNIHESEKLAGIMESLGYSQTNSEKEADVIIFNTCCIRENAEDRAKGNIGALKQLKKFNKNLIIAVGGCMTQQPEKATKLKKEFPFIDIIFGTHNLEDFKTLFEDKLSRKKSIINVLEKEGPVKEGTPKFRTSYPNAWINIMYGCNNFCTYCIVPYVRGRERSRKKEDIINEVKLVLRNGYKEITLLGQNVNSYGKDLGNIDFADLLEEIANLEGKFRLRFMTNHPKDLSEKLIKVVAKYDKICKHIHLPVQSGSTKILKLMNRRYTRENYLEKVNLIKQYIPNIAITSDVMVGFPGETDEDFLDTYNLMNEVEFSGAFTFIYSKRSGTPAATMKEQVNEKVSKERIQKLIQLQNDINRKQSKLYEGMEIEILCEGFDEKKKKYFGRDQFNRMTYFSSTKDIIGQFVNVKIENCGGISLMGKLI